MKHTVYVELMAELGAAPPGAIAPLQPPTEFRLFRAGKNHTRKGVFLFDDKAAKSVQARSELWGVEHAIDYNHAMVSATGADPALSGRAAGWFKLALRNGELWATDVRWTPAAHTAISNGEWRYISPTFHHDKSGRVEELLNVAITNLPATHKLDPLVALSIVVEGETGVTERRSMSALYVALGLANDASESEAVAKAAALAIEASKVAALSAEVEKLRADAAAKEAAQIAAEIDAAVSDGRLPPAQKSVMVKLAETHPGAVRELLAAAPRVVKMDAREEKPAAQASAAVQLSADDRKVAELLGLSDAEMLKARAAYVSAAQ